MRDDLVLVEDIFREVNFLIGLTDSLKYDEFVQDETKMRAAERSFEIIGEASRHVSDTMRTAWPDVPWRLMSDMRNLIIHDYFDVDYLILWDTIRLDLPTLHTQLELILRSK